MYERSNNTRASWWNQDFLIANLIVVLALVAVYWFPKQDSLWRATVSEVVFSILFPLVAARIFIRRPFSELGFGWGRSGTGVMTALSAVAVFGLLSFTVLSLFSVTLNDILPGKVYLQFNSFLKYTLIMWILLLGTEVLFRGVLLSAWKWVTGGPIAVIIQGGVVIFLIGLNGYLNEGIEAWRMILYGGWGVLAGVVAILSESVLYSFIFSILSVILVTVVSLAIL